MDENTRRRTLTILMLSTITTLIIVFSPLISSSNVNPQATIITFSPVITPIITPVITPITPPPVITIVPSFTLSASPTSITIVQGEEEHVTITVNSLFSFSSPVSFSSTSPSGVAVSFSPSSITPPANGKASTTARISVGESVEVGTYSITIYGTSGTLAKSTTITLVVKAAPTPISTPPKTYTLPPREFNVFILPYIILAAIIIIVIVLAIILLRRKKPAPPPPAPTPKPPEPTRRYCMHCGAVMPKDALFCPKCGKQPSGGPDTKTCPNCGSVINLVASYCPKCGAAQPKRG